MNELKVQLNSKLEELIALLDNYQEKNWSNYFSNIKYLLDEGDVQGINLLINLYRGGMGSFNDFHIHQRNGKKMKRNEMILVNSKLIELGKSISNLAKEIK